MPDSHARKKGPCLTREDLPGESGQILDQCDFQDPKGGTIPYKDICLAICLGNIVLNFTIENSFTQIKWKFP